MKEIVFATNNAHKLSEMRAITEGLLTIHSLKDIGCTEDLPETNPTLEGNAVQKAQYVKEHYGYECFADDTGLEVECLGGEPGVHSARYAPGAGHDSKANMKLLLEKMQGKSNRKARFRTVIALTNGDEPCLTFEGEVHGTILEEERGGDGFGYDPVFLPDGYKETFAQMSGEEKNSISHRGRATAKLLQYLKSKKN